MIILRLSWRLDLFSVWFHSQTQRPGTLKIEQIVKQQLFQETKLLLYLLLEYLLLLWCGNS